MEINVENECSICLDNLNENPNDTLNDNLNDNLNENPNDNLNNNRDTQNPEYPKTNLKISDIINQSSTRKKWSLLKTKNKYKNKNKYENKKPNIITLNCNHQFHRECIIKVENNLCPLCRQTIVDGDFCSENHITMFGAVGISRNGRCQYCYKKVFRYVFQNLS